MTNNAVGYVSVIGANLFDPILELVEKLETTAVVEPNEVQTSQPENGFACAIVALSVFLLESAINRTKYIRKDNEKTDIAEYFARISSDTELAKDIDEVVAVRDAIVHNHLWEANVYWDGAHSLKFRSPPKLLEGYGNKRQRRVINSKTRLSHRLSLNLFPPRIWRRDAYTTLRIVERALEVLEAIDRNYFTITYHYFMFRGEWQTLSQILIALPYIPKVG
jgi:hypothetical protein